MIKKQVCEAYQERLAQKYSLITPVYPSYRSMSKPVEEENQVSEQGINSVVHLKFLSILGEFKKILDGNAPSRSKYFTSLLQRHTQMTHNIFWNVTQTNILTI